MVSPELQIFLVLEARKAGEAADQTRTRLAFQKDAPLRQAIQRCGRAVAVRVLFGLRYHSM